MASNTVKARIQLKSDTEKNWNKAGPKPGSSGFIPLRGEVIIYLADDTHPFSRLKVGDGTTPVTDLPFVAGKQEMEIPILLIYHSLMIIQQVILVTQQYTFQKQTVHFGIIKLTAMKLFLRKL